MKTGRGDAETRKHGGDKPRFPRIAASRGLRLITLLTDFGTADYFVGAVKGVILSINPAARIVDITHDIPTQDIEAAAFTLLAASPSFPAGTIHVAVVDPGVGSSRQPLLVAAGEQFFIGPDNGIFSYVCEKSPLVFQLNNPKYFGPTISPTFHGRDIFAPVAAALSKGVKPTELGMRLDEWVRLPPLKPKPWRAGRLDGRIIHIDRFGNCVTNITRNELSAEKIAAGATLRVKGKRIKSFRDYFADEREGEKVFGVWGSAGFLEIAAKNKSAAELLKVRRGDSVVVTMA